MKYFHPHLILFFAITFVITPRPKNIRIFNTEDKNGKLFYEYTVFKDKTFGIQFKQGRGSPFHWEHLNDSLSKEQNPIIFLNTSSYFWTEDLVPQTQIMHMPFSNDTYIITINNVQVFGGTEEYYKIFKAVDVTNVNEPEYLHLIYTNGREIIKDVNINLWVCDEIYKDQCIDNDTMKCIFDQENKSCISKTLCDKVEIASQNSCQNAATSTPSLTKCIYENSEEQENCTIKKLCVNSLTEEECNSSITLNPKILKCIFNIEEDKCEIKELCELEENPSFTKCDEILTSNPSKTKCAFDPITNKCLINNIVPKIESPSTEVIINEIASEEISEIVINSDEIYEEIRCLFVRESNTCEQFLCNGIGDESITCNKIENLATNIKYVYNETQNICKKEEKLCYEIDNIKTEDICLNARVSNDNKICVLNKETKKCNEVDKEIEEEEAEEEKEEKKEEEEDSGNNLKYYYLLVWFLYFLLFI